MMTEEQEQYKKLLKEIQRQNFELYQIERKKILGDKSYQSQEENYINQLRQSDLINRIESYVEDKAYKYPVLVRMIIHAGYYFGINLLQVLKGRLDQKILIQVKQFLAEMNGANSCLMLV